MHSADDLVMYLGDFMDMLVGILMASLGCMEDMV